MKRRDRRRRRTRRRRPFEFSKIILAIVMATYELVTGFGIIIVWTKNDSLLPELLTFVGAPTAVAIGFYAWKARAENIRKIDKSVFRNFVTKEDDNNNGLG